MLSELDAPLSDVANKSGADREGELVAIVTGKALDAADSLPNGSVNVAEMFQVPSVSVGRVQFVAEPITYVHDTVVVPLVAEMVMVSPLVPPLALKVGVVSMVLLSESDAPESDDANKSRPVGATGAVPSIVIGNAVDDGEMLPAGSVNVDEMFHVPSVSVGSVQFVADPITYVHDTVVVPLVAEIVIVSPLFPPDALKVGVVSLVLLSVSDDPVSDAANKSTPDGADGAVVSIVIGNAVDDGEMLPAGSVSVDEMFHVPSVSVGSVQFVADPITYVHDTVVVPLVAEIVIVSPLVPPLALKVGVVSLVLLSELDAPVSDAANKSTPDGADGAVVSTEISRDCVVPVLPAASVTDAEIVHVPSDSAPRVQLVFAPTVYPHETVVTPFDAFTVMTSPVV
jgi:hypothetical protein